MLCGGPESARSPLGRMRGEAGEETRLETGQGPDGRALVGQAKAGRDWL